MFEQENHIVKITLNIPETRNALNRDMRVELLEVFRYISDDDSVKVVVMTGAGKAFCSGGDIRTMEGLTAIATRARLKNGQRLIKAMVEFEKPIIGAINALTP